MCLTFAAAVGAVVVAAAPSRAPVDPSSLPASVEVESDGLRYEYDALADCEALYDLSSPDGRGDDLSARRPDDLRRLREEALRRLGIEDLGQLRDAHRDVADALRRLGYL